MCVILLHFQDLTPGIEPKIRIFDSLLMIGGNEEIFAF